ncbi:MAG: hypothetical protein QM500_13950 [Methylococcales bacterium]
MSEKLSSVIGGRSDFITRDKGSGNIITGTSGLVLTLTPPIGQRVRITYLSTSVGATQVGVILAFGGVNLSASLTIDDGTTGTGVTSMSIGGIPVNSSTNPPRKAKRYITGGKDEAFTVSYSASGTNSVFYGFEFGE